VRKTDVGAQSVVEAIDAMVRPRQCAGETGEMPGRGARPAHAAGLLMRPRAKSSAITPSVRIDMGSPELAGRCQVRSPPRRQTRRCRINRVTRTILKHAL
jgi:hypothetical protein